MKLRLLILTAFFSTIGVGNIYGQGCSDAGFCTMNSFKPNGSESIDGQINQIKVGAFYGGADNSISVLGGYVEYNRQFNKRFGMDARLTTLAQSGNGISTFGFSDVFINANYNADKRLKFTLGTKVPLSNGGNAENNLALPMDYQPSLGTFDIILGVGYAIKNFQFAAALQQPLTQNENQFIASSYPVDSKLSSFQSTNKFERSGDVLLRISYPVKVNSKLQFTPSLLPIYHLSNDKYSDEFNVKREIDGSRGLTLNANAYIDYAVTSKSFIQLNIGVPLVLRDARPDGLARSFIVSAEYRFKF